MTVPAISPGTVLNLITFSEEQGEKCRFRRDCRREACYVGLFEPLGSCTHTRWPYCLPCAQVVIRRSQAEGPLWKCRPCAGEEWALSFIKMEPIR